MSDPGSPAAGVTESADAGPTLVLTAQELAVLEQAHAQELGWAPGDLEEPVEPGEPREPGETGDPTEADEAGAEAEEVQLDQARWSLTARGLLTRDGLLPVDTDLGLLVQTFLDVRVAAQALVVVERLTGEGRRDLRLLHLLPEGGVVEDVHAEGLHGLDLALSAPDMVEAVTRMVVPPDAVPGEGSDLVVEDVAGLPAALREPTVLAELSLVHPEGEEIGHLVALGPGGCWAGPRPNGRAPLRLRPVPPGWVGELVTGWVEATVRVGGAGTMGA